jgi:hypothetical protein
MVNNKLERIWKEAVVAYFKVLSWHLPEGLRKTTKTISQVRLSPSKMLMRIFGLITDKTAREWRKIVNEELHNLCSSLNIIRRMIKSRRMRRAGM